MRRAPRRMMGGAVLGALSIMLAGCVLLPQPSTSVEDLAGVWEFVDSQGVTSIMTIEADGRFTVDRAPVEVFRVLEQLEIDDWDGEVHWKRAERASGVASVDESGWIWLSTREPDWGAIRPYENPFRSSLEFVVGNADAGLSIDYVRVSGE
jgi:hypothetical protein